MENDIDINDVNVSEATTSPDSLFSEDETTSQDFSFIDEVATDEASSATGNGGLFSGLSFSGPLLSTSSSDGDSSHTSGTTTTHDKQNGTTTTTYHGSDGSTSTVTRHRDGTTTYKTTDSNGKTTYSGGTGAAIQSGSYGGGNVNTNTNTNTNGTTVQHGSGSSHSSSSSSSSSTANGDITSAAKEAGYTVNEDGTITTPSGTTIDPKTGSALQGSSQAVTQANTAFEEAQRTAAEKGAALDQAADAYDAAAADLSSKQEATQTAQANVSTAEAALQDAQKALEATNAEKQAAVDKAQSEYDQASKELSDAQQRLSDAGYSTDASGSFTSTDGSETLSKNGDTTTISSTDGKKTMELTTNGDETTIHMVTTGNVLTNTDTTFSVKDNGDGTLTVSMPKLSGGYSSETIRVNEDGSLSQPDGSPLGRTAAKSYVDIYIEVKEKSDAVDAVTKAQEKANEAQARVNTTKEAATSDTSALEQKVRDAQDALDKAKQAYEKAQADQATSEKALKEADEALQKAGQDLATAMDSYVKTQQAASDAQDALDKAAGTYEKKLLEADATRSEEGTKQTLKEATGIDVDTVDNKQLESNPEDYRSKGFTGLLEYVESVLNTSLWSGGETVGEMIRELHDALDMTNDPAVENAYANAFFDSMDEFRAIAQNPEMHWYQKLWAYTKAAWNFVSNLRSTFYNMPEGKIVKLVSGCLSITINTIGCLLFGGSQVLKVIGKQVISWIYRNIKKGVQDSFNTEDGNVTIHGVDTGRSTDRKDKDFWKAVFDDADKTNEYDNLDQLESTAYKPEVDLRNYSDYNYGLRDLTASDENVKNVLRYITAKSPIVRKVFVKSR